jgi:hypothetical protein
MAQDQTTRSKVSVNFGSRSNSFFDSRSKVLIIFWQFSALDQKFDNALKSFDLVFKVVGTDFGTRSKVLIMVFLTFKTIDLVKKVASSFLALDQKS